MAEDTKDTKDSTEDDTKVSDLEEQVARLEGAIKNERTTSRDAKKALKAFDGIDIDEARDALDAKSAAEEAKAKADGNWEDIRAKIETKHAKEIAGVSADRDKYKSAHEESVLGEGLTRAIVEAGFHPDYHNAARLELKAMRPAMVETDKGFAAVFVDDVDGEVPMEVFVKAWSQTDAAAKYMPGSGASGGDSDGGSRTRGGKAVIDANDPIAMGRNVDAIASGEAEARL